METSPNSREGIEKVAVKLWNIALDEDNKNARQEFRDVLHQELQKAREEERERIIYITKNIKDAFMSPLTERRWLQCIQFTDQPKPNDQSELDQPK